MALHRGVKFFQTDFYEQGGFIAQIYDDNFCVVAETKLSKEDMIYVHKFIGTELKKLEEPALVDGVIEGLNQCLTDLENQMAIIRREAEERGTSPYTLLDANGNYLIAPLLVSTGNIRAALANLRT